MVSQMGIGFKLHVLRVEVRMLPGSCGAQLACWWLGGKAASLRKEGL